MNHGNISFFRFSCLTFEIYYYFSNEMSHAGQLCLNKAWAGRGGSFHSSSDYIMLPIGPGLQDLILFSDVDRFKCCI